MRILNRQQAEAVVRRHGWLSEANSGFQDQLLARCDLLRVKPTQSVYQAGDEAGGLFGVVGGRLEIHLPRHGMEPTLAYIGRPGFWTGDAAAVRGHPRLISIVAGPRCQLLRLPREELHRLAASNPVTWSQVAILLARSVATAVNVIDALKRDDPGGRVAATLVNLLEELPPGHTVIDASQSDLASMAHLGRGSVNAVLKDLETRGLIRRRYGSIEVTKATAIRHFAGRSTRGVR